MALIPTDQRSQIMMLLVLVAGAGGYFFWTKVGSPQLDRIAAAHTEADSLQKIVEAAKADLANGTVEDLRRKVEEYSGSLELMKRLVPDRNEVPTLIDDISTKAKVRGITLGKIQPLTPEIGAPFDTYRYRLEVYGHYDQIGEYLADVASLPRIVVPQDVVLYSAPPATAKLLGDTAGSLLLAEFTIRTFVKSTSPPPPPAGKPEGPVRVLSVALVLTALAGPAAAQDTTRADSAPPAPQALLREVFAYEGGGRDPFMSLLRSGDVRPLISDLRLTTVVYDARYVARSVAVLRDVTTKPSRIYHVKVGDIIAASKSRKSGRAKSSLPSRNSGSSGRKRCRSPSRRRRHEALVRPRDALCRRASRGPPLAAAPPGDRGRDGEVRAVSVRPATGNVEVVIDLQEISGHRRPASPLKRKTYGTL